MLGGIAEFGVDGRRHIADGAVRPDGIVMAPPLFDDDPGFFERVEYLAVEEFVPEPGVEAFAIAVFPRRAWLDVGGLTTPLRLERVFHYRLPSTIFNFPMVLSERMR